MKSGFAFTFAKYLRALLYGGLITAATSVGAATLWSLPSSYLGTGYFYGPGAYAVPTPLFSVRIHNLAFTSDRDFVTPFWNNGGELPNITAEQAFPPADGRLSDNALINENVDLDVFSLAGTRFLPAVVRGGEFQGQQVAVTMKDGNLVMVMDLALDLGIGPRGIIRIPFYGTTGTVTVPQPLLDKAGSPLPAQAGPLRSGETLSGRIGDFNDNGFIDGTLVAAGVMPADSPLFPGQVFVMSRNFETDIPLEGARLGSPQAVNRAYGKPEEYRALEGETP